MIYLIRLLRIILFVPTLIFIFIWYSLSTIVFWTLGAAIYYLVMGVLDIDRLNYIWDSYLDFVYDHLFIYILGE